MIRNKIGYTRVNICILCRSHDHSHGNEDNEQSSSLSLKQNGEEKELVKKITQGATE